MLLSELFYKMSSNAKQNSLTIERFKKKSGAWATVPDSTTGIEWDDGYTSTTWFPIISSKPATIRTDIRVAKFEGGLWDLIIDGRYIESHQDAASLRDRFDQHYRFRYLRPAAIKLVPTNDEIEEILSRVVHPKKCGQGDLLLRYNSGPVLDCVCVRTHSKAGAIKIVGDEYQFSDDQFLPPTKYRKDQYRAGIQKLRAPIETALAFDGTTKTYPESPSLMVGRQGRERIPVVLESDSSVKNIVGSCLCRTQTDKLIGVMGWATDDDAQAARERYEAGELVLHLITKPISGVELRAGETFQGVAGPAMVLTQWGPLQIVLV